MELVIRNGYVLTPDMRLKRRDVGIDQGIITQIGECQGGEKVIDARGCIVMPGLVNTHTHTPMSLLQGLCGTHSFEEWQDCIWRAEAKLTAQDVYLGSLVACLEMIKSGTTTFADMYIHMDRVALAAGESRLRCVLGWGIIEGVGEPLPEKFTHRQRFVKKYRGHGRITAMYAAHSPLTCSTEVFARIAELAEQDDVPVSIHLLETEKEASLLEEGGYHLSALENTGLLSQHLLAAHCVHVNHRDIEVLSRKGVSVSHNPVSNLRLGVGTAPVPSMLSSGVNVCLGSDGVTSGGSLDMFSVMRAAALLANRKRHCVSVQEVLRMATARGAVALGLNTGEIREGCAGDVILVDMNRPHLVSHEPLSSLVYAACGSDVKTSIVGGEVLMEDYEVKVMDVEEVMHCARERMEELRGS